MDIVCSVASRLCVAVIVCRHAKVSANFVVATTIAVKRVAYRFSIDVGVSDVLFARFVRPSAVGILNPKVIVAIFHVGVNGQEALVVC